MRKTGPVTQQEKRFPETQKLVSSTDLKGVITHCNDAFVDISGYSREELIGQAHNIIRHPDMPQAAFANMWSYLKKGEPWMGLVKNRCKNGDFYWVNAYVTPVTEQGKVVGFESVRVCPARKDVARAEALYKKVNDGKSLTRWVDVVSPRTLWFGSTVVASSLLMAVEMPVVALSTALGGFAVHAFWAAKGQARVRSDVLGLLPHSFSDPLAVKAYTEDGPALGGIKVAIMSQKAHLDTVLTRLEDAANRVLSGSVESQEMTYESQQALIQQQAETEQVATAMNEMNATISEVSSNVQVTADKADEARSRSTEGQAVVADTRKAIEALKDTVDSIAQSVRDLSKETSGIAAAAQIIETIADQTNLLALNAAIEAARAGEHGRGFAVVADEVRSLAQRTQKSTKEIQAVVASLTAGSEKSVAVAEQGTKAAESGLEKMQATENTLNEITDVVGDIADMALQMAAAVEEQAQVTDQINQQVVNISVLAEQNREKGDQSTVRVKDIGMVAQELNELVVRFKQS